MTESSKGFNIASLKAKDTATMVLRDLNTGKDVPGVTFELHGMDSEPYRKAKLKIDRARAKKFTGQKRPHLDPGEIEQDNLKLLAACIGGWTGLEFNGEPFLYSPENALNVLETVPEIYDQIDQFVGDRRNFL